MEQLQNHLTECAFNPDAVVICDKGCNNKITRSEYEAANCFTHLANRQQEHFDKLISRLEEEITKLNDELRDVRCQVTHFENVTSRQQDEITKLSDKVDQQRDDLTKLTDEGSMQREEIKTLTDKVGQQRNAISKLNDDVLLL